MIEPHASLHGWLVVDRACSRSSFPAVAIAVVAPLELPPTKAVVQDFEGGNILTPIDDAVELRAHRRRPGNG